MTAGSGLRKASGAVFLGALVLYLLTLAPTVLWGDFGGYQIRAYTGDIPARQLVHPLWLHLIRPAILLPIGDVAYRVNLASALFGALTLVFVFNIIISLTRSMAAALPGTLALALSHTFWTYSVVPKTYTLNTLALAGSIYLLLRWREEGAAWHLWSVALTLGLSGTNHLVVFIALPGFLLFVLLNGHQLGRKRFLRQLAGAAVFFLLGLIPYALVALGDTTGGEARVAAGPLQALLSLLGWVQGYTAGFLQLFTRPRLLAFQVGVWIALLGYQFLDRTLFLADTEKYYDIDEIQRYFRIEPWGPLYKLVRRQRRTYYLR